MARWNLTGKRALVTGASGGLGAHFAKTLAAAGADVIIAARRKEAMDAVAQEIAATGHTCTAIELDVTSSSSIAGNAAIFAEVDILVNNAGIAREAPALDQREEDWDAVIDTNLKGMFLMSQAVGRAMRARGQGGSIINIASILGLRQGTNLMPYAVSKSGAVQMTKSLALELARFNIRVNAIAPGYFATDINAALWDTEAGKTIIRRIPQRRLGVLPDLDGPLLLLSSDMSAYMTGTVIEVDGGHLVSSL